MRLRETDGRAAVARLRLAAGIEAAWRSDLLEERYGADLPPDGGPAGRARSMSARGRARAAAAVRDGDAAGAAERRVGCAVAAAGTGPLR